MTMKIITTAKAFDDARKSMLETKQPVTAKWAKEIRTKVGTVIKDMDGVRKFMTENEVKDQDIDEDIFRKFGTIMPVVISQEEEDRHGDIVPVAAGNLEEYKRNPVMLWGHDSDDKPAIGNGLLPTLAGNQIRALAAYTSQELNPFAHSIGQMYANKILRAFSIGFMGDGSLIVDAKGIPTGGITWESWELLEFSAVNIGSNRSALAAAKSLGIDTAPLFSEITKQLDELGLVGVPRADLEAAWKLLNTKTAFSAIGILPAVKSAMKEARSAKRKAAAESVARKLAGEPSDDGVTVTHWQRAFSLLAKATPELVEDAIEASKIDVEDEDKIEAASVEAQSEIAAALADAAAVDAQAPETPAEAVAAESNPADGCAIVPPSDTVGVNEGVDAAKAADPTSTDINLDAEAIKALDAIVTKRLSAR